MYPILSGKILEKFMWAVNTIHVSVTVRWLEVLRSKPSWLYDLGNLFRGEEVEDSGKMKDGDIKTYEIHGVYSLHKQKNTHRMK